MLGAPASMAPPPPDVDPSTEMQGPDTHESFSPAMDVDDANGPLPMPSSSHASLVPSLDHCMRCGTLNKHKHWKFTAANERVCLTCAVPDAAPATPLAPALSAASVPPSLTDEDVQMREPGDTLGVQPRSAGLPRGKSGKSGKRNALGRGPCVSCAVTMDSRWHRDHDGRDMCGRCYDREYRARKKTEQAERVPPDASQPERRPPITRQTAPKAQAGAGGSVVDAIDVQPRKAAHSKANNTKTEAPLGTLNPSPSTSGLLPAASASFQPQAPEASSSAPVAHSASAAPPVDSKTAASAAGHIQPQGLEWKFNWQPVMSNGIDGALHTARAPLLIPTTPPVWAPSLAIFQNVWPELGTAVHGICAPTTYHDLPVVLLHDPAFRCAWLPSEPGQDTRIILSTTRVCIMNGKAARPHTVFPEATPAPLLTIDEAVCGAAAMQPGEWPPELKQLNRVCLSHGAVVALVTRERTPAVFSGAPAECGVAVLGAMRVQNIALHRFGGVEIAPDRAPTRPQAKLTIRWDIELIWTPSGQDFVHAPLRTMRPWWAPPGPDAPRKGPASSSAPPDIASTQPATTAFSVRPPSAALCTQLLPSYLLYPACVDFYLRYRGWPCGACGRINAQRYLVQRRCISCHIIALPLNLMEHKDICTVDDLWAAWERKAPVLGAHIAERAERFKDGMITYVYTCSKQVVSHISTARNLTLMGRPHARFAHVQELIERAESNELHWTYSCAASDTGQWTSTSESAQSLRKYAAYYARGYARDATFDPSALRADVWMAPAPGRAIEPPFTSAARTLVMCFGSDTEACVTFAITNPDADVASRTLRVHLVHGDALYIGNANVKVTLMQKGRMTGIVAATS